MIEVDTSLLEANGREVWREGGSTLCQEPCGFKGFGPNLSTWGLRDIALVDKSEVKVIETYNCRKIPNNDFRRLSKTF